MNRTGAISRCGDDMMRPHRYEAAQRQAEPAHIKVVLVSAWAMKIAKHRGMKKAIVALARRLAAVPLPSHMGRRH